MTPQSSFMVVAPLDRSRVAGLRELLASMNSAQGQADPANPVLPFGQLETLHFARIVLLDDQTMDDITAYRMPRVDYPLQLAFLGDFDGDYDDFLSELNARAGAGLRRARITWSSRSNSPNDHACQGQPRGVKGDSASAISAT